MRTDPEHVAATTTPASALQGGDALLDPAWPTMLLEQSSQELTRAIQALERRVAVLEQEWKLR